MRLLFVVRAIEICRCEEQRCEDAGCEHGCSFTVDYPTKGLRYGLLNMARQDVEIFRRGSWSVRE